MSGHSKASGKNYGKSHTPPGTAKTPYLTIKGKRDLIAIYRVQNV